MIFSIYLFLGQQLSIRHLDSNALTSLPSGPLVTFTHTHTHRLGLHYSHIMFYSHLIRGVSVPIARLKAHTTQQREEGETSFTSLTVILAHNAQCMECLLMFLLLHVLGIFWGLTALTAM